MAELRVKSTGTLKLFESDNTSSVTIASPASLGGDRTVTLPDADVTLVSGTMSTGLTAADITGQTALGATPADTDEFVLSDAGVLKRVDYSYIKAANSPSFSAYRNATQTISSAINTLVVFNAENYDTDSAYDTTTGRFTVPAGEGGKYFFTAGWVVMNLDDGNKCTINFFKNGSAYNNPSHNHDVTSSKANQAVHNQIQGILNLSAADYVTVEIYQNNGEDLDIYESQNHFGCCKLIGI